MDKKLGWISGKHEESLEASYGQWQGVGLQFLREQVGRTGKKTGRKKPPHVSENMMNTIAG